jgi:hypothetical protein
VAPKPPSSAPEAVPEADPELTKEQAEAVIADMQQGAIDDERAFAAL